MGSVTQNDGWIEVSLNTTQNEAMTAPGDTSPHTASTDTLAGLTEVPMTSREQRQLYKTNGKNRWYNGCLEAEGGGGNCPNRGQPLEKFGIQHQCWPPRRGIHWPAPKGAQGQGGGTKVLPGAHGKIHLYLWEPTPWRRDGQKLIPTKHAWSAEPRPPLA